MERMASSINSNVRKNLTKAKLAQGHAVYGVAFEYGNVRTVEIAGAGREIRPGHGSIIQGSEASILTYALCGIVAEVRVKSEPRVEAQ